jgi:hypothetical protein
MSDLTRDCERLDLFGADFERAGGVSMSGQIATPLNSSGTQYLIYVITPNAVISANQSCTGSYSWPRLVFATLPLNQAADVMTFTWTFARTKTGANRAYTATVSFASGFGSQSYSGTWADTTTPITSIRVRALATGNPTQNYPIIGGNVFLQNIPSGYGGGLSNFTAQTLGNP